MLIARSPVRISFGGGGTDLPSYFEQYGGAVLSSAINKYLYTIVGTRTDGHIQIISSDLKAIETWKDIRQMSARGNKFEIPLAVLKELECQESIDLFLACEIPPGTGLGSSASVCVNVLQAVSAYLNRTLSKGELAERAFYIATKVLGKPIGKQDEYAAAFGGLNLIEFRRDGSTRVTPVQLDSALLNSLQQRLMLFFTGSSHDSWSILTDQSERLKQNRPAVEALHRIHELAYSMHRALLEGNLHDFGALLHEGWEHKKSISEKISNPQIDCLYNAARSHGALGGKITGAGGGGFLLLYCEEESQPAVRDALAEFGVQEMRFDFDFNGARVLVNDPFLDRVYPHVSPVPVALDPIGGANIELKI
jgi:D-glycero-alpha-D-manno-heptose-7-phosphate kinase